MGKYILSGAAVVVCGALMYGSVLYYFGDSARYAEAATIAGGSQNFKELSGRFEDLAKEKGGVYAFEVLKRAALPSNTDIHLLGHVIGDVLYTQKGIPAMADCTQDFRNACSHTIVIGALNEFGEGALEMIRDACKKAPGGSGAYTMCFHGLGHGVFAYYAYDIPKTVAFCKQTGTKEYNNREYIECVGGMVMELMGGGGHDHDAWVASRTQYLTDDPLAPCSTSVIPAAAKSICYTYLTPHLFERAGADLGAPQKKDIAGSFLLCDRIPASEKQNRYSCFSGIGKELPILAVARDARALNNASDDALTYMRDMCSAAPHDESYKACTQSVIDSLFWGGENNPRVSMRFCELGEDEEENACFNYLFGIAAAYVPQAKRADFCALMPAAHTAACEKRFSL